MLGPGLRMKEIESAPPPWAYSMFVCLCASIQIQNQIWLTKQNSNTSCIRICIYFCSVKCKSSHVDKQDAI